jgi:hypothetical protein
MADAPEPPAVVKLHEAALTDIPAMLRRCADSIESGARGNAVAMAAVLVDSGGLPTVWAWGQIESELATMGLLQLGAYHLYQNLVVRE